MSLTKTLELFYYNNELRDQVPKFYSEQNTSAETNKDKTDMTTELLKWRKHWPVTNTKIDVKLFTASLPFLPESINLHVQTDCPLILVVRILWDNILLCQLK